jgi:hypothetical protein
MTRWMRALGINVLEEGRVERLRSAYSVEKFPE